MNLLYPFPCRSPRRKISAYQSEELDSGFLSSSSTDLFDSCGGLLENELRNEVIRSEKRRSALGESLRNAHSALEYQRNCLQQQDSDITLSKVTLESLLMRQELLESRLSDLKYNNVYSDFPKLRFSNMNEPQPSRLFSVVSDNNRITALEREMNDIKIKLRSHDPSRASNNSWRQSFYEERKYDEAEYMQMQEELRHSAELMEAKCSSAQRERDVLELEITSLHTGLHEAKVASKGLEKECVKLQSQVAASRNINESLYLEVTALKQQNQILENDVKGSEKEKKSLHLQVENLQQEKQRLMSQKELLFGIMKKKGKQKQHSVKRNKRNPVETEISKNGNKSYRDLVRGGSLSGLSNCSGHSQRLRRKKIAKSECKDHGNTRGTDVQLDCDRKYTQTEEDKSSQNTTQCSAFKASDLKSEQSSPRMDGHRKSSKRSEMNTEIIVACYQHLADLLRKLECLLVNNARLDHEKEQVLPFLLRTLKELQDSKTTSDKSREVVEQLLNEHTDLKENYHKRVNQITAVIIEVKHLRQAYNGIVRHSKDPGDRKAMLWISRVQAIKDSLKVLQEQTTNSLEKKDIDCFIKNYTKTNTKENKATI